MDNPMTEVQQFCQKLQPMAQAIRSWLERHPPELPHQEVDAFFDAIIQSAPRDDEKRSE